MRALELSDLLKAGDRIAVSNISGREASKVSAVSQNYCGNVVGGWALGKGGSIIESPKGGIKVFATFAELLRLLPKEEHPNKILIYSPPEAVYGDVKAVIKYGAELVETIFIVTEHVSIEVTAKIARLCQDANIDVLGCNTLGMINVHDRVRIGAVGGDNPEDTFQPGSVSIISNSGNMVNTIASYVSSEGMNISYGISTGKDRLILTPVLNLLKLAEKDQKTKIIVLYIEPGGTYEYEAIEYMRSHGFKKPLVVYVAGTIAEKYNVSLGHAGAVVEGEKSSARGKQGLFDEYFGIAPFEPGKKYEISAALKGALARGIRVETLHHIPAAVNLVREAMEIPRDNKKINRLKLNPWFMDLGDLSKILPSSLILSKGSVPMPYKEQLQLQQKSFLDGAIRQPMRNASKASSSDGITPRVYGYSLMDLMRGRSLTAALILYWTGELPENDFEEKLVEMTLIASMTNGPGTISAQGAKLSASAGNNPNTAMIATLASIGLVHGGNGAKAVKFLLDTFQGKSLKDPYDSKIDVNKLAGEVAKDFKRRKEASKTAGMDYERIPCLGHPIFKNDPVNFDPREQVISEYLQEHNRKNVFLEFYHSLAHALKENGSTSRVFAVNVDAAIACVWLALCWKRMKENQMTMKRVMDIPFIAFALGRVAGGAGEFLDHQDYGTNMDMRIPISEIRALTRPRLMK
jgi:succinyl-CoA synthetase alpha subunit